MTAGSEDVEWERQRTLEQEAERQLQKRIKDRVPQKRARGKAKAGDIDGMRIAVVVAIYNVFFTIHLYLSGAGSNSRRMGTMYIAGCKIRCPRPVTCHPILKSQKFTPVDLALELLNESSTGKDMRSFQSTKRLLFDALKGSVDSTLTTWPFSGGI